MDNVQALKRVQVVDGGSCVPAAHEAVTLVQHHGDLI